MILYALAVLPIYQNPDYTLSIIALLKNALFYEGGCLPYDTIIGIVETRLIASWTRSILSLRITLDKV
jgi:hypothetical protein